MDFKILNTIFFKKQGHKAERGIFVQNIFYGIKSGNEKNLGLNINF